jgi:hypothetical protein
LVSTPAGSVDQASMNCVGLSAVPLRVGTFPSGEKPIHCS